MTLSMTFVNPSPLKKYKSNLDKSEQEDILDYSVAKPQKSIIYVYDKHDYERKDNIFGFGIKCINCNKIVGCNMIDKNPS